jgi:hypothetical protein
MVTCHVYIKLCINLSARSPRERKTASVRSQRFISDFTVGKEILSVGSEDGSEAGINHKSGVANGAPTRPTRFLGKWEDACPVTVSSPKSGGISRGRVVPTLGSKCQIQIYGLGSWTERKRMIQWNFRLTKKNVCCAFRFTKKNLLSFKKIIYSIIFFTNKRYILCRYNLYLK